jgi:hypothetical protein
MAQAKVAKMIEQTESKIRVIVPLGILVAIVLVGMYLWWMGHFRYENLPVLGDDLLDNPTDGIKFQHYMWMKWIILGNTNCHWKTYMQPDSYIYYWIPLAETLWERKPTPPAEKEPRDDDHPYWNMETLLDEMEGAEDKAILEEYWTRIYTWAWKRYRLKKPRAQLDPNFGLQKATVVDATPSVKSLL